MSGTASPTTPTYTRRIARAHRANQRFVRGSHAIDERVLRITSQHLPPKERATYVASKRAEWAGRAPQVSTAPYPAAKPNEGRGVHFGIEWAYPSAGTFRLVTSKGDVLAACTVYGDDDGAYETVRNTLAAILDQKDPA